MIIAIIISVVVLLAVYYTNSLRNKTPLNLTLLAPSDKKKTTEITTQSQPVPTANTRREPGTPQAQPVSNHVTTEAHVKPGTQQPCKLLKCSGFGTGDQNFKYIKLINTIKQELDNIDSTYSDNIDNFETLKKKYGTLGIYSEANIYIKP